MHARCDVYIRPSLGRYTVNRKVICIRKISGQLELRATTAPALAVTRGAAWRSAGRAEFFSSALGEFRRTQISSRSPIQGDVAGWSQKAGPTDESSRAGPRSSFQVLGSLAKVASVGGFLPALPHGPHSTPVSRASGSSPGLPTVGGPPLQLQSGGWLCNIPFYLRNN